jgi:lysophospholipase L1-like esterase
MNFRNSTATLSFAYSGDTIGDMARISQSNAFCRELMDRRYSALLLSGGGNDLFDAIRRGHVLRKPVGDASGAAAYVDWAAVSRLKDYVAANYRRVLAWRQKRRSKNRGTPFLLHTYDYPMPRPAKAEVMGLPAVGTWLHAPLLAVGAPVDLHFEIIRRVVDRLADTTLALADPSAGIHVVDTRGQLIPAQPGTTGDSNDWANEVHPNESGYEKIATLLCAELKRLGVS